MTFLNNLLYWIANICVIVWHYCSELGKRWKLRESAFRSAGHEAVRRRYAGDLGQHPFLLQARHVFNMIGNAWSSARLFAVRRLEAIHARCLQESEQEEAYDLEDVRNQCKRLLGYVPKFNPFATGLYWIGLFVGGVIEFFLNSAALEGGGQSENLTRILAVILSLAFIFCVDRLGQHRAQGKSILVPTLLLTVLIVLVTLIREDAIVGYVKRVQESVPELRTGETDPRVYVFLFCAVQVLFFYIGYHWAVQHHDPLLSELHEARMAERRKRSYKRMIESINRRLDNKAIECLSDWEEYQNFFHHRVMVFIEAAAPHRGKGDIVFSRLELAEPQIVTWSRTRLGNRPPPAHATSDGSGGNKTAGRDGQGPCEKEPEKETVQ